MEDERDMCIVRKFGVGKFCVVVVENCLLFIGEFGNDV